MPDEDLVSAVLEEYPTSYRTQLLELPGETSVLTRDDIERIRRAAVENAPAGLSQEEFGEYVAIQIGKAVGQAEGRHFSPRIAMLSPPDPVWAD